MPASLAKTRKPLVAGLLILVAGLLGLLARAPQPRPVVLPDVVPAFAAAGVEQLGASRIGDDGDQFRQWTVEDGAGDQALVYVEATREPQRVLGWTGQLGFQGAGYQVRDLQTRTLTAAGDEASTAYLTGASGELAMAATDLGPDGVSLGGVSAAPRLLLDELAGQRSLWYLVRVTMVAGGAATTARAAHLLAAMVPSLVRSRTEQA